MVTNTLSMCGEGPIYTPSQHVGVWAFTNAEKHRIERTPSPPPRKKSLSPPHAPSTSTSGRSTYQTISFSPSESPTPTHVTPAPKLRFVITMKLEPQELPSQQTPPHKSHVLIVDNWPPGLSNPSPPPLLSHPPPGFKHPPLGVVMHFYAVDRQDYTVLEQNATGKSSSFYPSFYLDFEDLSVILGLSEVVDRTWCVTWRALMTRDVVPMVKEGARGPGLRGTLRIVWELLVAYKIVGVDEQGPFRNKNGALSQSVNASCSFDMKFHYVLAGWEGSAPDLKVLNSALTRRNKLQVPEGKYFLVDFKYENIPGFIAPYHVLYIITYVTRSQMTASSKFTSMDELTVVQPVGFEKPEMMTNADSRIMAADLPFDIQLIEVKVLYDAVSVQILSSANNIHVVENNSVAQLLHYAITSDGHLQCCAARLRSNHQYANVPIPTESLCAVSPIIIVSNK
ncbi:hypothetical protein Tco_0823033 [Tanacetum coccineum]|uniref:Uncharacterized protein n=1 Tax=Tanacetum coccineum TaxID=301880 RepID=A0ABQ5AIK2_9ASTR